MFATKVNIKRKGTAPKAFLQSQLAEIELMKPKVERLAYEASKKFQDTINARRHRKGQYNKNSLANAFKTYDVEYGRYGVKFGVGDVDYLDAQYPYWYSADVGGIIPPPTVGWFGRHKRPDYNLAGKGSQVFHENPTGYKMVPKQRTRPLNYIKITTDWLNQRWNQVWGRTEFK